MEYSKYKFFCIFNSSAKLPFYKGSTFRGVFGHALKNVVCALKHNECETCLLCRNCIYALVFETKSACDIPDKSRISAIPHPFVIEPPLTEQREYKPGDSFDFNLILFGKTNKNFPYFIYALEQMGKLGVGKKINNNRGTFKLSKVAANGKIIYSASEQKILSHDLLTLNLNMDHNNGTKEIIINLTLETPLRLKFKNKLNAELPFHILTRAMLRRISTLFQFYGNGEPDIDYKDLVKDAENIKIIKNNLKWFDWKRYSSRQKEKMFMGGLTGTVTYKGKLTKYLPLLDLCSKTHIGKQTAFGLGKIRTEVIK